MQIDKKNIYMIILKYIKILYCILIYFDKECRKGMIDMENPELEPYGWDCLVCSVCLVCGLNVLGIENVANTVIFA